MMKTQKNNPLISYPLEIMPLNTRNKLAPAAKMRPTTPDLKISRPAGPSSPPETPTTSSFTFGTPTQSGRRNGVSNFSRPFSAPNGSKGSKGGAGQRHHVGYDPSMRPEDISPRSSSSSSSDDDSDSPPRSLSSSPDIPEYVKPKPSVGQSVIVAQGNFTIEEMGDSDMQYDSDDALSVVQPDFYEDAESEIAQERQPNPTMSDLDARILADGLEKLDCNNHSDEREAWLKRERKMRRKKRLSSGSIHKRTLSQSIGSDTDDEDVQQLDASEAGSSARRLRRKTGDRGSLIFDDPPQMIVELDEPESDDEVVRTQVAEPDVAVDVEELGLHSLPYYELDTDSMEIDYDSD